MGQPTVGREIGRQRLFEVREPPAQLALVDLTMALLLLVLDNQQRAVIAQLFDHVEPVIEVRILLACVCDEGIQRTFGEEELMRGVINLLPAEVPDVDAEVTPVLHRKVPLNHLNAFGRILFLQLVVRVFNLLRQRRFTRSAFADNEELGLIKMIYSFGFELTEVILDSLNVCKTLIINVKNLWRRIL